MTVEQSRKRGPFDSRYLSIRHKPAPASLRRPGEERIEWQEFVARFFPGCRRHDFDALAAYESYRNEDVDADTPPGGAETARWEGEGGAARASEGGSDMSRSTPRSSEEAAATREQDHGR